MVQKGFEASITIVGLNIEDGDRVKIANVSATDCSEASRRYAVVRSKNVTFVPQIPGLYGLCYQWRTGSITPYYFFPAVQLAVIAYDSMTPFATAPGCESTLTISGSNFLFAGNSTPTSECVFDGLGVTPVTSVSDSSMTCTSPVPDNSMVDHVGPAFVRTDFGAAGVLLALVTSSFTVFNVNESVIQVHSVWPQAAPYNLAPT